MDNDKRSLMDQLEFAVDGMLRGQPVALVSDPELGKLLALASDLKDLPRADFLLKLKTELGKGGTRMATRTVSPSPVRPGFHTVTPYITANRAPELVEFLKQAFGAEETFRTTGSGGGLHMEVRIGDSMLMVGGAGEWKGPDFPGKFVYFVSDPDQIYQRALDAGASSLYPPINQPYGCRDAGVRDLAGNEWFISSPRKGEESIGEHTLTVGMQAANAERMLAFLQNALGAEPVQVVRAGTPETIVHSKLRIGDSIIEMSQAHGQWQPSKSGYLLYVDDSDRWFQRAVEAGAKEVFPVADQPYGRIGGVVDEEGNQWYFSTHRE